MWDILDEARDPLSHEYADWLLTFPNRQSVKVDGNKHNDAIGGLEYPSCVLWNICQKQTFANVAKAFPVNDAGSSHNTAAVCGKLHHTPGSIVLEQYKIHKKSSKKY